MCKKGLRGLSPESFTIGVQPLTNTKPDHCFDQEAIINQMSINCGTEVNSKIKDIKIKYLRI